VDTFSLTQVFGGLENAEPALGVTLAGIGLILMTVGARMDRLFIPACYMAVGMVLGVEMVSDPILRWLAGVIAAALLVVASRHFHRLAVGVLCGAWGAFWVAYLAHSLGMHEAMAMALAVISFAIGVSLAFVVLPEVTAALLSFQGTVLLVAGVVIVGSCRPGLWVYVRSIFLEYPLYVGFLLLSGTIIGYYLQMTEARRKAMGTSG